jgi:hypothetical protein
LHSSPDGQARASRFKQQQVAWATTETTQPSSELGDSVLLSTPIDSAPYLKVIDAIPATRYVNLQWRGNHYMAAGDAAKARQAFDQALLVANAKQMQLPYVCGSWAGRWRTNGTQNQSTCNDTAIGKSCNQNKVNIVCGQQEIMTFQNASCVDVHCQITGWGSATSAGCVLWAIL